MAAFVAGATGGAFVAVALFVVAYVQRPAIVAVVLQHKVCSRNCTGGCVDPWNRWNVKGDWWVSIVLVGGNETGGGTLGNGAASW